MDEERLQGIYLRFKSHAEIECRGSSPLYERLSLDIAEDDELLKIAGHTRNRQPIPNLFFASVHWLLQRDKGSELGDYYPSISDNPKSSDPFPTFRDFCITHRDEIVKLLSFRRVQTNVVERCSLLLPGFSMIASKTNGKPLSLIEIGTSAGLNLYWDKYAYNYGEGRVYGKSDSPITIPGEFRGNLRPNISQPFPEVVHQVGVDLNVIDVNDEDEIAWLRALVWPEHKARLERMNAAIKIVRENPLELREGDAIELLPKIFESIPSDSVPCIFHTHTVNQFSPEAKDKLNSIFEGFGQKRDFFVLSSEYRQSIHEWVEGKHGDEVRPTMELISYVGGQREMRVLAKCDPHGRWIEWLDES